MVDCRCLPGLNMILLLFLDHSSFTVNLQQRRDSSVHLGGEDALYIYRLCFRCYTPNTIHLENSWFLLFLLRNFQTNKEFYMPVDEFLTRLKMTNKVPKASKQKSEGVHSGKRVDSPLSRERQRPSSLTSSDMSNPTSNT